MDYHITDIAEKAGVSRPTVHGHIEDLVDLGLVVRTRNVGRSRMFRINTDNGIVREVLGTDMRNARGLEVEA